MAITWGSAITNSSGNGLRLGYELTMSPSRVGSGTSSVTVTLKLYVGTRASVYDSTNSWSISGDFSGSGNANISHGSSSPWSGSNVTRIATRTKTVTPSYTSTTRVDFSAAISGVNAVPGTARVSGAYTVPRRPISAPAAPTGATVTRNSDTSQTVRWTNTSPTSVSNPYQKIEVRRWDIEAGSFKTIATINTATSYTDKTTVPNQQYRYAVRAKNTAGSSGWAYTDYMSTTPAAPGTPKAVKTSGGDIRLTWSLAGVRKNTGVEVWLTEAGVDAPAKHVLLPANTTSWTHTSPDPAKTWAYRLKAQTGADSNDAAPNLYSPFSGRSNTVQLLTNPLAPTELSPASMVRDGDDPITLTWQHNEVDGTEQTAYRVGHRAKGTSTWTYTPKVDSTTASHTLPGGTYSNGQTIEWIVQTWGLYADPSPYSAAAQITLSTPPSATILTPTDDEVLGTITATVTWAYADPEGNPQAQWRATLMDLNGTAIETRSGSGTTSSTTFTTALADGGAYRVGVQVRDSTGLWSLQDEVPVTVEYPLPPVAGLAAIWDHDTGTVILTITNPPTVEGEVDAEYNELYRSINGQEWQKIATGIPLNTSITDYIPGIGVLNHYRVVTISGMPSKAEAEPVEVNTTDHRWWVWVSAGPGFVTSVRIRDNAKLDVESSREKVLRKFAGRSKPVEYVGEQRDRRISLSARFAPESSTPADVEHLADLPAPACLRFPDGRRYFVSTGAPSIGQAGVTAELSWSFTEIDYNEAIEGGTE